MSFPMDMDNTNQEKDFDASKIISEIKSIHCYQ